MNKKVFLILVVFVVLCVLPLFSVISAEEIDSENERTFIFPSSIEIIEDEAFEGTAVETVVFHEGLISIGFRAFANVHALKNIYIPVTTTYIADAAFSITSDFTIHGRDNSYAKDWAHIHEIPFVVDNVWNTTAQNGISIKTRTDPIHLYIAAIYLVILFQLFRLGSCELRSKRPQDCPELYPIDYRFP